MDGEGKEMGRRLIDADVLLDDVRKHSASYFADDFAKEWVDKQPTVDAAPVVRCKDCIRYLPNGEVWGRCPVMPYRMRKKDFCSYGLRKDGEQK